MYNSTDFIVAKDIIIGAGGFTHVCYDSTTNGYYQYWESKNALKRAKQYAKEKGFKRLIIVSKTIRTKDKIYDL